MKFEAMKSEKVLHFLEVVVLILIMFLVIMGILISRKEYGKTHTDTTTEIPSQIELTTNAEETAHPTSAPETTTEWIAEIVYDDYEASEIVPENFNSTVVLGNSQAMALANYGLLKNADFSTKVGLSINRVLTSDQGQPAPIDKLKGKSYEKAVFVFGENELGWPYPESFISEYKKVIQRVRDMNPGVEIYVQGIFPVSAEYSAKSKSGITNENVEKFNKNLKAMCEEIDATFMEVSGAFMDANGALPDGVATDGVHFGYDYCKIWAGDLSAYLE